jgi:DNA-directed RNA polymerase subunit F
METIGEEDVDIVKATEIMNKKKEEKDLVYEQKICLDYLEKIPKVKQSKLKEMVEELSKISILKNRYIVLIVNVMPDTEEEVEALFSKERTNLKKEEITQIAQIVRKYK